MATARTIARNVLLFIALGAALVAVGCGGGDGGEGEEPGFGRSAPARPEGIDFTVFANGLLAFEYPQDWTAEEQTPGHNQTSALKLRSPNGTTMHIWQVQGGDVSSELPEAVAPNDEEAVEYILAQLHPGATGPYVED
jgi:hypothetical protein